MNEVAASAEWLNAEMHPMLRYVGALRFEGDQPTAVAGELDRADFGLTQFNSDGAARLTLRIQVEALHQGKPERP